MMAETQMSKFQKSVDAGSLIFAHSVLDAVAFDYCRVTALVSPLSWERFVDQKPIKLQEFRNQAYEALLKAKIDEYFQVLDRSPLLTKVDRLFEVCKPPDKFSPLRDYEFNRDRLAALDTNRHAVVHKLTLANPLPRGDDDIWFLMSTANYVMAMINERFGLRIDPTKFITGNNS